MSLRLFFILAGISQSGQEVGMARQAILLLINSLENQIQKE